MLNDTENISNDENKIEVSLYKAFYNSTILLPKGGLWNEIVYSDKSHSPSFSYCGGLIHKGGCSLQNRLSLALGSSPAHVCNS